MTTSPVQAIADALAKHQHGASIPKSLSAECPDHLACTCGKWVSKHCKTMTAREEHRLHQAEVIAALPGIAVVDTENPPTRWYSAAYRAANGNIIPVGCENTLSEYVKETVDEWNRDSPETDTFLAYRDVPTWNVAARTAGGDQ